MSLRDFHIAILVALISVAGLSLAWESWLEDRLMPGLVSHHETEAAAQRWEFGLTTVDFAAIALSGPLITGGRMIRRERALHERVNRLSQEDHLTGVLNRRRITELPEIKLQRPQRYLMRLSFILIDIVHFKAVKDRIGHKTGDGCPFGPLRPSRYRRGGANGQFRKADLIGMT